MAREPCNCQWCAHGRRAFQGRPVSELSQLTVLARLLCRNRVGDFGPEGVCRFASRSLLGHSFGAELAPGGSSLFCFGFAALRVTVSVPDPP